MSGFLSLAGETYPVALIRTPQGYALQGHGPIEPALDAIVAVDGNRVWVHLHGRAFELVWQDAVAHYAAEGDADETSAARAPMPGSVVSIAVAEGQPVASGDLLLVIESMKLETAIRATRDGVVEAVHVTVGQTFDRDALLVSLEQDDAA